MPLFDFSCRKCENQFEALVMNGERVECPECHGGSIDRLLSAPAKPRSNGESLPISSKSNLPPCGPGCCRL